MKGCDNEYSLWFNYGTEDAVFALKPELGLIETYMEFDTAEDVYKWIETLPSLKDVEVDTRLIASASEMYNLPQHQARMMHKMGFTEERDNIQKVLEKITP